MLFLRLRSEKIAAIAPFVGFRCQVSGFGCQETEVLNSCRKLQLNGSQKKIEHRTLNIERPTSNKEFCRIKNN